MCKYVYSSKFQLCIRNTEFGDERNNGMPVDMWHDSLEASNLIMGLSTSPWWLPGNSDVESARSTACRQKKSIIKEFRRNTIDLVSLIRRILTSPLWSAVESAGCF